MKELFKKILLVVIALLLFIGFGIWIILLINYFSPPESANPRLERMYPDYEAECVPNFMGGCDPQ